MGIAKILNDGPLAVAIFEIKIEFSEGRYSSTHLSGAVNQPDGIRGGAPYSLRFQAFTAITDAIWVASRG